MPPKIDPAKFSEGKAQLIYTDSQKYPRASVTNHLDGLTKHAWSLSPPDIVVNRTILQTG